MIAATVADLNGDGMNDGVVVNLSSGSISVLLGNGDGTFQPAVNYATGANSGSVAVGDFNGDGVPDLAVLTGGSSSTATDPAHISILAGNGDGTFQAPVNTRVTNGIGSLAAGDFNGDGMLDLVVTSINAILIGNGDGTFKAPANLSNAFLQSSGKVTAGDFDGDGKLDIAMTAGSTNPQIGTVQVLLGTGTGGFSSPVAFPVGKSDIFVAASDFNQDGKLDLVTANMDVMAAFRYSSAREMEPFRRQSIIRQVPRP